MCSVLFFISCSVIFVEVVVKEFEFEFYVWWFFVNSVIFVYIDFYEVGLGLFLGVDGCFCKWCGYCYFKD